MKTRRLAILATVLAASGGLAACGNKEKVVREAATEGIYVDVGALKYQVQISRQLNPTNIEDKGYLVGLSPFDRTLGADNVWFAVFIKAENDDQDRTAAAAKTFELRDTQEHVFTPLELGDTNVFAYRPMVVVKATSRSSGLNPPVDSPAAEGPTAGSLLLFKLPRETLDNRPLELVISPPEGGEKGVVTLDV
jgi:hypothetical protein